MISNDMPNYTDKLSPSGKPKGSSIRNLLSTIKADSARVSISRSSSKPVNGKLPPLAQREGDKSSDTTPNNSNYELGLDNTSSSQLSPSRNLSNLENNDESTVNYNEDEQEPAIDFQR